MQDSSRLNKRALAMNAPGHDRPGPGQGLAHCGAQGTFCSPTGHTSRVSEGGTGKAEPAHHLCKGPVSVSLCGTGSLGNESQPDCCLSSVLSQRRALQSLEAPLPGSAGL